MDAATLYVIVMLATVPGTGGLLFRYLHGGPSVRAAHAIVALYLAVGGCAVSTDQQRLGYGQYVAFSCDQLGQEAVRLMRETTNRSEHILENDQARRDTAMRELKAVKQASADKQC